MYVTALIEREEVLKHAENMSSVSHIQVPEISDDHIQGMGNILKCVISRCHDRKV